MAKGRKRRQKGEYTRPEKNAPPPPLLLPPAKMARFNEVFVSFIFATGLIWLWEVGDPEDVAVLSAATGWYVQIPLPQTEEEFWNGPSFAVREGLGDEASVAD